MFTTLPPPIYLVTHFLSFIYMDTFVLICLLDHVASNLETHTSLPPPHMYTYTKQCTLCILTRINKQRETNSLSLSLATLFFSLSCPPDFFLSLSILHTLSVLLSISLYLSVCLPLSACLPHTLYPSFTHTLC